MKDNSVEIFYESFLLKARRKQAVVMVVVVAFFSPAGVLGEGLLIHSPSEEISQS